MKRLMLVLALLLSGAFGQVSGPANRIIRKTAAPATCSVGQVVTDLSMTPAILKVCLTSNTWTTVGASASNGLDVPLTVTSGAAGEGMARNATNDGWVNARPGMSVRTVATNTYTFDCANASVGDNAGEVYFTYAGTVTATLPAVSGTCPSGSIIHVLAKSGTTVNLQTGITDTVLPTQACTYSNDGSNWRRDSCSFVTGAIPAQYKTWSCPFGIDGAGSAIAAATYTYDYQCVNDTGATLTITDILCISDNAGTSTGNVADSDTNGLLNSAITANTTWVTGTKSATTTIANGKWMKWTFVADGTSKQIQCRVKGTY